MKTSIKIKVIPNSDKNEILNTTDGLLKIKVTAPPIKGKANEAVIKLLAKELGIKRKQIAIVSGQKSKIKTIQINDCGEK